MNPYRSNAHEHEVFRARTPFARHFCWWPAHTMATLLLVVAMFVMMEALVHDFIAAYEAQEKALVKCGCRDKGNVSK